MFRLLLSIFFCAFLTLPSVVYASEDCALFYPWLSSLEKMGKPGDSIQIYEEGEQKERDARTLLSKNIFHQYIHSDFNMELIDTCIGSHPGITEANKNTFIATFQRVFLGQSIEHLRALTEKNHLPKLKSFLGLYEEKFSKTHLHLFKIVCHFDIDKPALYVAGSHRVTGGIYACLKEIPRQDYFVYFVHELIHSLDQLRDLAVEEYSDKADLVKTILESKTEKDPQGTETIDAWLKAGMSRNLLAEYRAWLATAHIYLEMSQTHSLWTRVSWFDEKLGESKAHDLSRKVFDVLDSRSENPTAGIFEHPFLQERMKLMRKGFRKSLGQIPLGVLSEITQNR